MTPRFDCCSIRNRLVGSAPCCVRCHDGTQGDKKSFDKPVLVTLSPGSNIQAVGFITKESLQNIGHADEMAVYLPQSYNFAGNLIVVPKDQVSLLEADSGDLMAFIVSGGVTSS